MGIDLKNENGDLALGRPVPFKLLNCKANPGLIPLSVLEEKTGIRRYRLKRDEKGHIVRTEFKKYNGSDIPVCNEDKVYGFEYRIDDLGRITNVFYLGRDGAMISDRNGVMGKRYVYDKWSNIKRTEYFDAQGMPVLNKELWSSMECVSDEFGNIIEETYYGTDGTLITNCAKVLKRYH